MNIDLRLLVRLLIAILLASLVSTIIMGSQIHKRIVNSLAKKINQRDIPITEMPTRQLPKREIPRKVVILSQNELDVLKIQPHGKFHLPNQEAMKDWQSCPIKEHQWGTGLGELGKAAELPSANEKEAADKLYKLHGFNAKLSDFIALNRSLPDIRPLSCWKREYLEVLPNVTIIMAFHNEHLSVLLRSLTSIINRSPRELLKQIVLVDDGSNLPDLGKKLKDFVAMNFPKIVEIVRLKEHRGLIKAKVEGAKRATSQVLIFLDSHIEVNINWLPPLLEPIVVNRKIVTGPISDVILHKTFAYMKYNALTRSGFNWLLEIKELPPFYDEVELLSRPYRTPLLVGPLAIDRNYFWELGGYDEELKLVGGEQFEMSFKVWMCGGMLLYVPCSRVGQLNKEPKTSTRDNDLVARNFKRVAEVWMDEYRKYVYDSNPELYKNTHPGSLNHLKTLRTSLKCKSFDWYMNYVAADFLKAFPPEDPSHILSGSIESVAFPGFCVDSLHQKHMKPVVLSRCTGNKTEPGESQNWFLTEDHEIRLTTSEDDCLEAQGLKSKSVWLFRCHGDAGNQSWFYNRRHQWIQQGQMWVWCLEAHLNKGKEFGKVLSNNKCDKNKKSQQWKFGEVQ
ncbi:putative polypeptide N-acetylgalactosaminyltransferase 10 [Drosophila takahashii]|uniref:putative polypeptide N-acetylgalactosaminyltransferase 10 n=1 Tax=Drosophila takahashii TaxID=29030 RepID=UPI001CF7F1EE|nr:putative polypeptide N-acetylgalactosaminyltransferase 10 [Drosophila takahashii]